eukprot:3545575-Pyramimonas_sp.AAC.1
METLELPPDCCLLFPDPMFSFCIVSRGSSSDASPGPGTDVYQALPAWGPANVALSCPFLAGRLAPTPPSLPLLFD